MLIQVANVHIGTLFILTMFLMLISFKYFIEFFSIFNTCVFFKGKYIDAFKPNFPVFR